MSCKGLSSSVLSLHTRSSDRDVAFGSVGPGIPAPNYCTVCKVHLPEEKDMETTSMQLFIEAVWWRWQASKEPAKTIFTHFCRVADDVCVTVNKDSEDCIKRHLRNRLEFTCRMSDSDAEAAVNAPPAKRD